MKIREIFSVSRANNKYDAAIRAFYLIFYAAGLIIFVALGLNSMELRTWVLAFFSAAIGATAYGTVVKMIINMVRKDRRESRADTLINLFYVVFFSVATIAFFAIGLQYNNLKTWLIAFVGSYGAAAIYSAIARLVVTLSRKDKQGEATI